MVRHLLLFAFTLAACRQVPRPIEPAPDYGLKLISITPRPGTPLVAGRAAHFAVTVAYRLEATDSGDVVLVVQDERGHNLLSGRPQISSGVTKGSGELTLTDSLAVPSGIREVQLFVLLAPKGYQRVYGQIPIQFPVR